MTLACHADVGSVLVDGLMVWRTHDEKADSTDSQSEKDDTNSFE
jgi:hypothetical protein